MKKMANLLLCLLLVFGIIPMVSAESGVNPANIPGAKYLPFDEVGGLSEGLAFYVVFENNEGKVGFIDTTGNIVIPAKYTNVFPFSEGLAAVQVGLKWGFIDKTGKEIIAPQYDMVYSFDDGLAQVTRDEKWGYVDKTGKEVIEIQYENTNGFSDGVTSLVKDNTYRYVDKTGKDVLVGQYDIIRFSEGLAGVQVNGKYGYIDKTGNIAIQPQYDFTFGFSGGLARVELNGKSSFIDKTGKEVNFPYAEIGNFNDDGLAMAYINDNSGIIDKTGKIVVEPKYFEVQSNFSEGLTYGLNFVNEGEVQQSYIDKTGKEVLKLKEGFQGSQFNNGIAVVTDGDNYYFIPNPLTSSVTKTLYATPTASNVLVNGQPIAFEAYNIGGNNYFKLRDLAMAVNGTEKNFEVSWDGAKNAINLISNHAYTPDGKELAVSGQSTNKQAKPTSSKMYLDGQEVQLTAYNLDGNNFFKLRDIAKLINCGVTWDGATNTIGIDTHIDYVE